MSTTLEKETTTSCRSSRQPNYQVKESTTGWTVEAQTPGVAKDGFQLSLHDRVLTVRAQVTSQVPESWQPLHRETDSRDFRLDLRLPARVNHDGITARLRDGVLTVELPRSEADQPRTIEVQA